MSTHHSLADLSCTSKGFSLAQFFTVLRKEVVATLAQPFLQTSPQTLSVTFLDEKIYIF